MRHYEFQDPKDRSPNAPAVIASATRVKALYNQAHPNDKVSNITDTVRNWFAKESKKIGWHDVDFVGNECVLKVKF